MKVQSNGILPLFAIVASLAVTACQNQGDAPAQDEAAANRETEMQTPTISVNRQMVSLIDNESHVLWDAEQEGRAPSSEGDWNTIEDHALQIYAAGHLLLAGGSGPQDAEWASQPVWQMQTRAMMDAAMAAASAAASKNMEALITANGQLVDSCLACHEAFKPELPTEGRAHQHTPTEAEERRDRIVDESFNREQRDAANAAR
jgi:cytochrome c556